jgi:hypothetical protein
LGWGRLQAPFRGGCPSMNSGSPLLCFMGRQGHVLGGEFVNEKAKHFGITE